MPDRRVADGSKDLANRAPCVVHSNEVDQLGAKSSLGSHDDSGSQATDRRSAMGGYVAGFDG
jgi:hypothetical protein